MKQPGTSLTIMPVWKQDGEISDGEIWRLHVGDKVVGSLLPDADDGVIAYVMLFHTDWPCRLADRHDVSDWYDLNHAKDFMRRCWILAEAFTNCRMELGL